MLFEEKQTSKDSPTRGHGFNSFYVKTFYKNVEKYFQIHSNAFSVQVNLCKCLAELL